MTSKFQGLFAAGLLLSTLLACNTGDGACGDGVVQRDRGEACEPGLLLEETCESLGFYPGTLACADCGYSYVGCGGFCGDGRVQAAFGEACDGDDLGGATCVGLGHAYGTLACLPDCSGLDTTACRLLAMVEVPGGTFQRDDDPANLSTVTGFFMSVKEITRAQYWLVMGRDPTDETRSSGPGDPVQNVSWVEAADFCNELSRREGRDPAYQFNYPYATRVVSVNLDADGYRLPTEMEWMWAAMGADTAAPGAVNRTGHLTPFAGSDGENAPGDFAVFGYGSGEEGATRFNRTEPTCRRQPNILGFCDLSGNAREWVQDQFFEWPAGPLTDFHRKDIYPGDTRVLKGGSWTSKAVWLALSYRVECREFEQQAGFGFRVVRRGPR